MTPLEQIFAALCLLYLGILIGIKYQKKRTEKEHNTHLQNFKTEIQTKILEPFHKSFREEYSKISQDQKQDLIQLAQTQFKATSEQIQSAVDTKNAPVTKSLEDIRKLMDTVKEKQISTETVIKSLHTTTEKLTNSTTGLEQALSSKTDRGQWGDRVTEDILRTLGFQEGIQYIRQETKQDGRPDYTFFLPENKKINMDVKYPYDNYHKYCQSENEKDRQEHKKQLIKNAKAMLNDLSKRINTKDYIHENTVDFIIMFIPNEQIFHFIHEAEQSLIDEALQKKVLLCSPLTLYATLAIIRQGLENFNFQVKTREIHELLLKIEKEWEKFTREFTKMGTQLQTVQKTYTELTSTRSRALDKPFQALKSLKQDEPKTQDSSVTQELSDSPKELEPLSLE